MSEQRPTGRLRPAAAGLAALGGLLGLAVATVGSATAQPAAQPSVVVTIKPLHALVAQVMAGVGTPELLVKGAASPHTFALRPSEARGLQRADMLVRMSEAVEPFTGRLVRSLPKSVEVVTLQDAPRMKLLGRRTEATFEPHSHAGDGHKGHRHAHGHGHDHRAPDAVDGHAWLDPDNAAAMADRIAEALGARHPAHAATFRANAEGLKLRLVALAAELEGKLAPIARQPYIVFHDAYQYLERRYGLSVVGSISVSPDVPASAKRLRELRRKITELGAVCVFAEPQVDTRLVANLIEGTRARSGSLDPEGGSLEPGPDLYFTLMRKLAADLAACLAAPA